MKLFEYMQISKMDYINQSLLSKMGKEGWELVQHKINKPTIKK